MQLCACGLARFLSVFACSSSVLTCLCVRLCVLAYLHSIAHGILDKRSVCVYVCVCVVKR